MKYLKRLLKIMLLFLLMAVMVCPVALIIEGHENIGAIVWIIGFVLVYIFKDEIDNVLTPM